MDQNASGWSPLQYPAQRQGRVRSPNAPRDGGLGETALPVRKHIPHDIPDSIPPWVACNAIFFITINTLPRGKNQLANEAVFDAVVESIVHRQNIGLMWTKTFLLMPDHLHGLFSFSPEVSMRGVIADWKRFLARRCGVVWQRDFFDHRIRQDESESEKWNYIRMNPVRKGFVANPDAWSFQWRCGDRDAVKG